MRQSTIANPYLALQSAEDEQAIVHNSVKDNSQFPTLDHVAYKEDESMATGSQEYACLTKHLPHVLPIIRPSILPALNADSHCLSTRRDVSRFVHLNENFAVTCITDRIGSFDGSLVSFR